MNRNTLEAMTSLNTWDPQTKDGSNIHRGSKDQTGARTLSNEATTRLAILWKNKVTSFPTKIKLYKSLVNTAIWLPELDVEEVDVVIAVHHG